MKLDFLSIAQGRVAEQLVEHPALSQGVTPAAAKRAVRMIERGAAAVATLLAVSATILAPQVANAQAPEQVLNHRIQDAAGQAIGNYTRSGAGGHEARQLADNAVRALTGQPMRQGAQVAVPAVAASLLARLVDPKAKNATYALAGAVGASAGYAYDQASRPSGPQAQFINRQVAGAAFFSPRDLGMPQKFTEVSKRSRMGMVAPGPRPWDLRDGSPTSNQMVRALDNLERSLDAHMQSQQILNEARLSMAPLSRQDQAAVNQRYSATNGGVDRAIENYIRISNEGGLHGLNTTPWNRLAAQLVQQRLAPEQQVNMAVNARVNYGYGR